MSRSASRLLATFAPALQGPARRWLTGRGLHRVLGLAVGIVLAGTTIRDASAQRMGYQLERGAQTPAGSVQLLVARPWYAPSRYVAAGITLAYDRNLLRLPGQVDAVVAHSLLGSVDVAGSPLHWLQISASLPVTFFEAGTPDATSGESPVRAAAIGDPHVALMARLWGDLERDRFSAHLGVDGWPGIGAASGQRTALSSRHEGDSEGRILAPRIVLAGAFAERGRWGVDAGFLYRPVAVLGTGDAQVLAGSQVQLGFALSYLSMGERLHLGIETRLSARVTGFEYSARDVARVDLMATAQTLLARQLLLGLGVGAPVVGGGGPGSPPLSLILRLAWAPLSNRRHVGLDVDKDGIPDANDRCPYEPETANGYRDEDGCPDELPTLPDLRPAAPAAESEDLAPTTPATGTASIAANTRTSAEQASAGQAPLSATTGALVTDRDGDGIPDSEDRCPVSPEDRDQFEDEDGCPELDNDDDGIVDVADLCPLEAETKNGQFDDDGCPERPGARIAITRDQLVLSEPVRYRAASAVLDTRSLPLLRELAKTLREHPGFVIEIQGHTDDVGGKQQNLRLSQARADAVRTFLQKNGIAKARLSARGYGATRPVESNRTPVGRSRNRRVELWLIKGGAA